MRLQTFIALLGFPHHYSIYCLLTLTEEGRKTCSCEGDSVVVSDVSLSCFLASDKDAYGIIGQIPGGFLNTT